MSTREVPYATGDRNDEAFESVAAYSTTTRDQVIPNGETWQVSEFQGSAAYSPDASAKVIWDRTGTPDVLASTHGDATFILMRNCAGDGTKKLSIVLDNQTANEQLLGGKYIATRVI